MSGHRDSSVWLDASEARCEPAALPQCGRFTCGRYKAPIAPGSPMADYNHDRTAYGQPCSHWISSELRPAAQPAKRAVYKSIGG